MDEVFGGADLSRVEDIGVAAQHAKELDDAARRAKGLDDPDVEETEAVHASKV